MATLNQFSANPTTVPPGGASTVTITFNVTPPQSDLTADLTVYENGEQRGQVLGVVLQGQPGEPVPTVTLGATGSGWELRTTAGVLAALGNNQFSLTR